MKANGTHNELSLVCAAREGDKEAMQALLGRNWFWLKALVYSVLGSVQDLDDVMQEVCLRVITRIHTLREPECFRAWLAVLARREALKQCQHKARRVAGADAESESSQMAGHVDGPLEELERQELCRQIQDAVEALPQIYREAFLLAHSGELTYAQMAEVLDVPVTTMQIRLVRARRMIQNQVFGKSERKVHER
jgi:RNA polymerase sigma factor (sigma-70 family)